MACRIAVENWIAFGGRLIRFQRLVLRPQRTGLKRRDWAASLAHGSIPAFMRRSGAALSPAEYAGHFFGVPWFCSAGRSDLLEIGQQLA